MIVAEGPQRRALVVVQIHASMGPQHDSCGREAPPMSHIRVGKLQWGRNMIVAEGENVACRECQCQLLQWGRNMIVAEGDMAYLVRCVDVELQWGRNMIVAEGGEDVRGDSAEATLQWGRNMIVAEGAFRPLSTCRPAGFNGAAT